MNTFSRVLTACMIALGVAACASQSSTPNDDYRYGSVVEYGRVTDIERVAAGGGSTGAGAVIGGVVGGVVGHQIGSGRGNDAATVVGAVGGALVGNSIEKNNAAAREAYRISVRLEGGGSRVYEQDSNDGLRVGDSVRIANGRVSRN